MSINVRVSTAKYDELYAEARRRRISVPDVVRQKIARMWRLPDGREQ